MVQMAATGIESEDDVQGTPTPKPGRYHAVIKEVDESYERFDKVIIEFEILGGTVPAQEGSTLSEFFSVTPNSVPRLKRLAIVLGLLTPGEGEKDIEFAPAIGRQLVIEVEDNQYEKNGVTKKTRRMTFYGCWSLDNPAVADVPKNAEAMKLHQGGTATDPVPATAATEKTDPYAGL